MAIAPQTGPERQRLNIAGARRPSLGGYLAHNCSNDPHSCYMEITDLRDLASHLY